jgi:hypothetical protein
VQAGAVQLPHGRRASVLESAWDELRRRVSGPIGCLVLLLCLPFALLALLGFLVAAFWKARRLRRQIEDHLGAQRDAADAAPTALFVRLFAADASFTREEAEQTAVPAGAGKPPAALLDDALRRGWVEEAGDGLRVTDAGRAAVDALLTSRGL